MSNENQKINQIVEVHRDNSGEIQLVKLDDGRILSRVDAAIKINMGELCIPGVLTAESKEGEPYLRSMPDGDRTNNLSDLPEISDYSGYQGSTNMEIERTRIENNQQ